MNPFAQFSARSSYVHVPAKTNSAGWIHTKKRGRDDEEIARDQARVLEARRRAKAVSRPVKPRVDKKLSKKVNNKLSKKHRRSYTSSEDDDDDDESMDGFIVNDDEDIEEYDESSPEKQSRHSKEKKSRNDTKLESFSVPRRTKTPVLDITSTASPSSSSTSVDDFRLRPKDKTNLALDDTYSTDGDSSLKLKIKEKDQKKSKNQQSSSENSDKEFDDLDFHRSKHKKDRSFNTESECDEFGLHRLKRQKDKSTIRHTSKKKANIFSDDFEDDPTPDSHCTQPSTWNEDDFVDDDEAAAIVYAMEESLRTCKHDGKMKSKGKLLNPKQNVRSHQVKVPSQMRTVELATEKSEDIIFDEKSSDSHDDMLDIEDYKDGTENDIQVILKAVNVLSSRILNKMMRGGRTNETVISEIIPGLVVDGALALTTMDSLPTSTFEHDILGPSVDDRWITQEDISTVCHDLKLADYQLVGVNWLWLIHGLICDLSAVGLRGHKYLSTKVSSILADDMGLGKTIQTIAFLAWLKKHNPASDPHLIIVPASVLANWERELHLFCPQMVVVKYHGTVDERAETKDRLRMLLKDKVGDLERLDVVLTTYSYFSSEKSDDRVFLKKIQWNYVSIFCSFNFTVDLYFTL